MIRAMRVDSAAHRAGYKPTVVEIFSNPVICHMAAAVKEAIVVMSMLNKLQQFSLAPAEDSDTLFHLIKEPAIYYEVGDDNIEDV